MILLSSAAQLDQLLQDVIGDPDEFILSDGRLVIKDPDYQMPIIDIGVDDGFPNLIIVNIDITFMPVDDELFWAVWEDGRFELYEAEDPGPEDEFTLKPLDEQKIQFAVTQWNRAIEGMNQPTVYD
jgi:hypothetical protein